MMLRLVALALLLLLFWQHLQQRRGGDRGNGGLRAADAAPPPPLPPIARAPSVLPPLLPPLATAAPFAATVSPPPPPPPPPLPPYSPPATATVAVTAATESSSSETQLRPCSAAEGGLPSARAVPILPTSALVHAPAHPNWASSLLAGPCVVRIEELLPPLQARSNALSPATPPPPPVFSVLLNVWNRERQVRTALVQLLKLTREPWELIVFVDGASDGSLRAVNAVLDELLAPPGWPACAASADEVAARAGDVWPNGTAAASVGEVGLACHLRGAPPLPLVRALVLALPTTAASMQETFANNVQMRVAAAAAAAPPEFLVIVQDDQLMTLPGWNVALAAPARAFVDVFSVSARCAHSWPEYGDAAGAKCGDSLAVQAPLEAGAPAGHWSFHVRDSGNRGPLLLRARAARELGFLDEVHFAGMWTRGNDDHELNKRAYGYGAWPPRRLVSGVLPIPYTEERCCRSPDAGGDAALRAQMHGWWDARRAQAPPLPEMLGASGAHNELRFLPALNVSA